MIWQFRRSIMINRKKLLNLLILTNYINAQDFYTFSNQLRFLHELPVTTSKLPDVPEPIKNFEYEQAQNEFNKLAIKPVTLEEKIAYVGQIQKIIPSVFTHIQNDINRLPKSDMSAENLEHADNINNLISQVRSFVDGKEIILTDKDYMKLIEQFDVQLEPFKEKIQEQARNKEKELNDKISTLLGVLPVYTRTPKNITIIENPLAVLGLKPKWEFHGESEHDIFQKNKDRKAGNTETEIKKAYRALSLKWHPNRVLGNVEKKIANEIFIILQQAYEQLIPKPPQIFESDKDQNETSNKKTGEL